MRGWGWGSVLFRLNDLFILIMNLMTQCEIKQKLSDIHYMMIISFHMYCNCKYSKQRRRKTKLTAHDTKRYSDKKN